MGFGCWFVSKANGGIVMAEGLILLETLSRLVSVLSFAIGIIVGIFFIIFFKRIYEFFKKVK